MKAVPHDQFRDAIKAAGIAPPEFIEQDGALHRFASDGTRGDDAGWYVFHNGDISVGAFGCWRAGISETWRADIGRKLTKEEVAAQRRQMEDARRKREAEEKKLKAKARERAAKIWQRAASAPEDHPYLARKGVKAHGLKVDHGELVVPLRDSAGVLHSLEFIAADGAKNYLLGGRVSGCFFMIGEPIGALCVAEGFATAASVFECAGIATAVGFNSGNLPPVANGLRAKFPDAKIVVCPDDDVGTPGNPGLSKGREAAQGAGAFLAVPEFGQNRPDGLSDFNDLFQHAGPEAVRACIERAAPFERPEDAAAKGEPNGIEEEIARLAALREVNYLCERKEAAKRLGWPVSALDKLVTAKRPKEDKPGQGRLLELPAPEPWPEPANGADLLSEIADAVRKYVVLSNEDADTAALWCVHTFAFEAFPCTPRLAITSPEKRCGKTTLLDVIESLAARPLQTSNISAAAVFRTVEIARPTLLIDEADTFLGDKDELRGILNSGHRQGGQAIRIVGDNFEPRAFSTHSPCAIAMIGKLPDTLADRSVVVSLKRRLPSESISPFRSDRVDALKVLARKAARWTADNAARLGDADPDLPPSIFNREADNWRPLFSIAAVVGGDWPERTHRAALALTGAPEDSLKAELLADIRDAFAGKDRISSDELVAYLISLEERPWSESNHGKPMTKNQLARRLKPFGLKPKTIRESGGTAKGYTLHDFDKTCTRYLPPPFQTVTSGTTNEFNWLRGNQTGTLGFSATVSKSINPSDIIDVTDVTVQKGETANASMLRVPAWGMRTMQTQKSVCNPGRKKQAPLFGGTGHECT